MMKTNQKKKKINLPVVMGSIIIIFFVVIALLAPYIAPAVSILVTEDEYESATELIRSRAEKEND